jgi:ABC-type nickel/cobalt efflux system permease component RcnA
VQTLERPAVARRGRVLTLGLAGGLTPSPTALLLLLAATAAGRAWAGALAVLAFGLGMALTLTAVGTLAAAGRLRLATAAERGGTLARVAVVLPRLAGLGVVGGGSLLVLRSLAQVW